MVKNKNLIRAENIKKVKKFMFSKCSAIKSEISNETGISVVTVNTLVKQLVEDQVLIEGEVIQQIIGRPAAIYRFNYDRNYFLLISIQERIVAKKRKLFIIGKVINIAGKVTMEKSFNFDNITLANLVSKVEHFLNCEFELSKIGISFPGKIFNGIVLSSWEGLFNQWNIEQALGEVTSIPILIHNDAHLLTIGDILVKQIKRENTVVGIFYPKDSMPGISIYSNGSFIEGSHNLAGEAKFLPHLIGPTQPMRNSTLIDNLIEIISIYNVVIAPDVFIISADSVNKDEFLSKIKQSPVISQQINKPELLFVENFSDSLDVGLRWLVTQDSDYIN